MSKRRTQTYKRKTTQGGTRKRRTQTYKRRNDTNSAMKRYYKTHESWKDEPMVYRKRTNEMKRDRDEM